MTGAPDVDSEFGGMTVECDQCPNMLHLDEEDVPNWESALAALNWFVFEDSDRRLITVCPQCTVEW